MNEEKLTKLLNDLADATAEPVRPGLSEDIKQQIPKRISTHKGGTDTVHIVINLRISKLAAAAVIILTILLCAGLFGGREWTSDGIVDGVKDSLAWLGAGKPTSWPSGQNMRIWFDRESMSFITAIELLPAIKMRYSCI